MTNGEQPDELGVPGRARAVAKYGLEQAIWARVRWAQWRSKRPRKPSIVPPTDLLRTETQWRAWVEECKRLGLPLHHDGPKNWDALGAVSTIVNELGTDVKVLDAGAARYSTILTSLALYGVSELVGNNLEFHRVHRHGSVRFEYGDVTNTMYRDGYFDAVTCMSVIEHGVPIEGFLRETAIVCGRAACSYYPPTTPRNHQTLRESTPTGYKSRYSRPTAFDRWWSRQVGSVSNWTAPFNSTITTMSSTGSEWALSTRSFDSPSGEFDLILRNGSTTLLYPKTWAGGDLR